MHSLSLSLPLMLYHMNNLDILQNSALQDPAALKETEDSPT